MDHPIEHIKSKIAWHHEQIEAGMAEACKLYAADYTDQCCPVVDAVCDYLITIEITHEELEQQIWKARKRQ